MVKIPDLFDLFLTKANPTRRDFLRKSLGGFTEAQPSRMNATELVRYLRNPSEKEDGFHTWWAADGAMHEALKESKDYGKWLIFSERLQEGRESAEELQQMVPLLEQVLPRFREIYSQMSDRVIQGRIKRLGPTDLMED